MIVRQWKGIAKADRAADYVTHLQRDTFPQLARIEGFRGGRILQRSLPEGEEFVVETLWDSMAAVTRFAGDEPEEAVVPAAVVAMMVSYNPTVCHYTVIDELAPAIQPIPVLSS